MTTYSVEYYAQSNGQLVAKEIEADSPYEAMTKAADDPQQPAGQIKSIEVKQ